MQPSWEKSFRSPNFADVEIPVEFVVLHYTGCDLKRTLEIFGRPNGTTSHFVVDESGKVWDLGGLREDGRVLRGAHAGVSRLFVDGRDWQAFNEFSIGIEIVNLNGNLYDFSEAQYKALEGLLGWLRSRYPALQSATRFVGHEHIAGFRGKCDPGFKFDWSRVLADQGLRPEPFHEVHACRDEDLQFLREKLAAAAGQKESPDFWSGLSTELESRIRSRNV